MTSDDFSNNFRIKTQEEIDDINYWKKVREWQSLLPVKRCPFCDFRNIYRESIEHHIRYTKIKGHPNA